jgi:tetratricopeptide (TPR) repeat protein
MSKKILLTICTVTLLFAQNTVFTIQLYTSDTLKPAEHYFKKLPKFIKPKSFIVKIGKYYTIRCCISHKPPLKDYRKIKKIIKDAFIAKMYSWRIKTIIYPKRKIKHNENITLELQKADDLYKEGKIQKSLNEYLKIFKYENTLKNKINTAYLYGLLGNLKGFETFIKKYGKNEMVLYSFAVGMINRGDLNKLKPFIFKNLKYSQTGYLNIIAGYILEKEKKYKKAFVQYKNGYFKNMKNPYFIYAYARAFDLIGKYKNAIKYYSKLLKEKNILEKYAKQRINQLRFVQ